MKLNLLYLLARICLETDAGVVNEAILSGIQCLNDSIASLVAIMGS